MMHGLSNKSHIRNMKTINKGHCHLVKSGTCSSLFDGIYFVIKN